ncbi:MAG: hypothetical protein ABIC68_07605 [Candidatus Omnitrophota bacterium]
MKKSFCVLALSVFCALMMGIVSLWAQEETEVVIVATQHFITDMPQGYTPAHLRALLKKILPDLLAVEAPDNVADGWKYAPLDLWQVTKPWADEYGVKIVYAGFYEPMYQAQLSEMFADFQKKGVFGEYEQMENKFQVQSAREVSTCEFMNSPQAFKLWRDYHTQLHGFYGKDTPWEIWNEKIAENILSLCRQNRGKRMAVVFGGAHCYYIKDRLSGQKDVRIIPISYFFPLTDAEVEKETCPLDYLKALRLLNFNIGTVTPEQLKRLKGFLDKIRDVPELNNDYHLFYGKYLLHMGRAQEALVEFQKVASLSPDVVSLFDGQSCLREAGLQYINIAKNQLGR